jgi:hypothetical protein
MSDDVPKIIIAKEDVPFSLACYGCDAGDGIGSMEEAVREGWKGIEYDDGAGWNFLGHCPGCQRENAEAGYSVL